MTNFASTPIAIWKDEYLTGNAQIDREHQTLFEMFNALHVELHTTARHDVLKSMLIDINSHTVEHFQNEEALMQSHDYPGYDRHKHVHDNLLKKVSKLIMQFERQADFIPNDHLTEFLHEWLAHHIRGEDRNMIYYFRSMVAA